MNETAVLAAFTVAFAGSLGAGLLVYPPALDFMNEAHSLGYISEELARLYAKAVSLATTLLSILLIFILMVIVFWGWRVIYVVVDFLLSLFS